MKQGSQDLRVEQTCDSLQDWSSFGSEHTEHFSG